MTSKRIQRMVRHFPENGLKVLLEDPRNVQDLLRILQVKLLPQEGEWLVLAREARPSEAKELREKSGFYRLRLDGSVQVD